MRPTLFTLALGGHELGIRSYGVLVGIGFAVGIVLAWREGRRNGLDGGRLLDLSFWGLVVGIAGARASYVLVNAPTFVDACQAARSSGSVSAWSLAGCLAPLRFWEGGLVFYGGLVAAAGTALVFARRESWSFGRLADLFAPSAAAGHAIGRLGCLAAGCCFGKPTSVFWGLAFPPGSVAHEELAGASRIGHASATPPLHPTQIYEFLGELGLLALLLGLRRRWKRAPSPPPAGALFAVYVAGYALLRFSVETVRGDAGRRLLATWTSPPLAALLRVRAEEPLFLSTSQVVSLGTLVAIVLVAGRRLKHQAAGRSS